MQQDLAPTHLPQVQATVESEMGKTRSKHMKQTTKTTKGREENQLSEKVENFHKRNFVGRPIIKGRRKRFEFPRYDNAG